MEAIAEDFVKLPWPNIAGFLTCLSLTLFADLKVQLHEEHTANIGRFDHLDSTLKLQDAAMKQHAEDSAIHNGRKG